MNSSYISKDIAKLRFAGWYHETYSDDEILKILDDIPISDVAPVRHGQWKLHDNGDGTCSRCGVHQKHIWDMDGWQNYCGHCGAKMDGRHDNV